MEKLLERRAREHESNEVHDHEYLNNAIGIHGHLRYEPHYSHPPFLSFIAMKLVIDLPEKLSRKLWC